MAEQWYQYQNTQGFKWSWQNQVGHSGIDIGMPVGTAITSPVTGIVVGQSYHNWGGQVDIRFQSGGQTMVVSFLHLSQIANLKINQPVAVGMVLGYSGGVNQGAHPTLPQYSSGPHLHFELTQGPTAPYTTYNPQRSSASNHPVDPSTLLNNIRRGGLPAAGSSPLTSSGVDLAQQTANADQTGSSSNTQSPGEAAHQFLTEVPGFLGIAEALDAVEQFQPYTGGHATFLGQSIPDAGYPVFWVVRNMAAISSRMLFVGIGMVLVIGVLISLVLSNRWVLEAGKTAGGLL